MWLGPPAVDVTVASLDSGSVVRRAVDYLSLEELVGRVAWAVVRKGGQWKIHSIAATAYGLSVVLSGALSGDEFVALVEGVFEMEGGQ